MSLPFVIRCLKRAIKNNNTKNLIIHSDQGVHFTCKEYVDLLEQNNITLSHSRKGNCHDNAPIESFFSLYIDKLYKYCDTKKQVDKYMLYYNKQRIQIGFYGKTTSEFRLSA